MNRTFALLVGLSALALSACCADQFSCSISTCESSSSEPYAFPEPARLPNQKSVLGLRTAPIKNVRVGFVGIGMRGSSTVDRFMHLKEGSTIAGLCDKLERQVKNQVGKLERAGYIKEKGEPKQYIGEDAWKKMCEDPNIDLIYITTNWALHTPIALYAMEHGKHVVTEVPAAMTIEDCWKLVDTAERKQVHFMMAENCNYDFFEMAIFNMARKGKLGEIMHGEGAYIHDLRSLTYSNNGYIDKWRLHESAPVSSCVYPTHGIGPIAHVMNIHRGDKMNTITSFATAPVGNKIYADKHMGPNSNEAKVDMKMGDMSNTLIKTEKGKTILIQHDVTSPRPYDRLFKVSGTKGFAQKYPNEGVALEWSKANGDDFDSNAHGWLNPNKRSELLKENQHPIVTKIEDKARQVGGHGGMDFIMDYRIIYCLNNGLPLDQDAYDAAEWSAIVELSSKSNEMGGAPIKFPDFTRGSWNEIQGTKYYDVDGEIK